MNKFTHQAPVIKVKKETHPDATSLSIVPLFGTTQVVVASSSWEDGELAVYIQPQSIVDTWKEEFTFLNKGDGEQFVRVKPVKLRGILSNGCLVKVPAELIGLVAEGDDLAEKLGITHWEPELEALSTGGNCVSGLSLSKYDIDGGAKLHKYFEDGELVFVEMKIHGSNVGVKYNPETSSFMVRTRKNWIEEFPKSEHWKAFHSLQEPILNFLKENPNLILYGESTGNVKGFRYGLEGGKIQLFAFDIYDTLMETFLDIKDRNDIFDKYGVVHPPLVGVFPHNYQFLERLTTKLSMPNVDHVMEGIVVRPMYERKNIKGERVIYKIISPEFNAN